MSARASNSDVTVTAGNQKRVRRVEVDANYLIPYASLGQEYLPYNPDRALPFPSGTWNEDQFITIDANGKSVTFAMQQGPYNTAGHNGVYVDRIIQFALALVRHANAPGSPMRSREYSQVETYLEDALKTLVMRQVVRIVSGTHGSGK
jgi:hypothetical protein